MLKIKGDTSKVKFKNFSPAKPVALAVNAPMLHGGQKNFTSSFSAFAPFVTECTVRLVSSAKDVPVKILRDTGSSKTFVLCCLFPLSPILEVMF